MKLSKIWIFAAVYLVVTLTMLFLSTPRSLFIQHLSLFYKEPSIPTRVHDVIVDNPNGNNAFFTRFFHNKASFSLNTAFLSLTRSIDPVFFFSLFQKPYYGDSWYTFTSPLYFPFFLIGAVTLIRKRDKVKKQYYFLLYFLGFSLVIAALFTPYTAPLKLVPLFITVQFIIFFGCYEAIKSI